MIEKISFQVGNERLVGQLVLSHTKEKPSVLFVHGAGKATKERSQPLAERLAERSISSFAWDCSGHGESTGTMNHSSLQKRTIEAQMALTYTDPNQPLSICGFSMG